MGTDDYPVILPAGRIRELASAFRDISEQGKTAWRLDSDEARHFALSYTISRATAGLDLVEAILNRAGLEPPLPGGDWDWQACGTHEPLECTCSSLQRSAARLRKMTEGL